MGQNKTKPLLSTRNWVKRGKNCYWVKQLNKTGQGCVGESNGIKWGEFYIGYEARIVIRLGCIKRGKNYY